MTTKYQEELTARKQAALDENQKLLNLVTAAKRTFTKGEQVLFDSRCLEASECAAVIAGEFENLSDKWSESRGRQTVTEVVGAGTGDERERSGVLKAEERFADRVSRPVGAPHVGLGGLVRAMYGRGTPEQRSVLAGATGANGEVLVPTYIAAQILDAAAEESALIRAGAQRVAMKAREHVLPRVTADPTLAWRAELGTVAEEQEPAIGAATLSAKSLAGVAVMSMELLEDSAADLEQAVMRSFGRAVARALDKAAFQGAGPNGPASLFADTAIPVSTAVFPAPPVAADNASLADIAAELADAEGGDLSFVIMAHADLASLRTQQASTAGTWLGAPPGLQNVRLIGSAQMLSTSTHVLAGSMGEAIAIGMLGEIRFKPTDAYLINRAYPAAGSAIGGAVALAVFARGDIVAVQPARLLRVPTDRTP